MTNKVDFGDVITAMVTPFKNGDTSSVDLDGVELLANYLLRNGTDTILLTGSTGEAAQLSSQEKSDIIKRVRNFTPKGTKLMVAIGDENTQRTIHQAKTAFDLGADAILVTVPKYIKPPPQALINYFGAVAQAIDNKPMMIYNIPSRTGTEIAPETVAKLAHAHPNIVGIKQSMGNMDRVSEMRILCPDDFQIYSGDDSLTLPMLALGARGVVSVVSHLEGKLIKQMVQEFKANRPKNAYALHHLLYPLYKAMFVTTNPLPIKEALYEKQLIESPTLRTLGEMSQDEKIKLNHDLYHFNCAKQLFFEERKGPKGPVR